MKKTLLLILLFCFPLLSSAEFSDVPANHPYSEAIKYSKENNIVNGYSDGTFKPENKINRAEFTKIIIETVFTQNEINNCIDNNIQPNWTYIFFPDVSRNDWFAKYVCIAKTKGIISGYSDGTFQPNNNISFVEAAKIIDKAFEYNSTQADDIWYKYYVVNLAGKQSIPQTITKLDKEITRSEFVEIIWRLKTKKYDLPSMAYLKAEYGLIYNLGGNYFNHKGNIYYSSFFKLIEDADIETFDSIDDSYAKDKNYVYIKDRIIKNANPKTFEIIEIPYAMDNSYIYHDGNILEDADLMSFEIINKAYSRDKYHVYISSRIVEGMDPITFEIIEAPYVKDKNHVYAFGVVLKNSDSATFRPLQGRYAKDKNQVYLNEEILKNADVLTFEVFDGKYAKDKNHVYYSSYNNIDQIINVADSVTFEYIDSCYAKDKNNVYCYGEIVENADPATFEYINEYYSKDINNIYCLDKIFKKPDIETFEVLSDGYSKDKSYIFYENEILENADVESFEVIVDNLEVDGKDKNNYFLKGRQFDEIPREKLKLIGAKFHWDDTMYVVLSFNMELDKEIAENIENYSIEELQIHRAKLINKNSIELNVADRDFDKIYTIKVKNIKTADEKMIIDSEFDSVEIK